MSATLSPAPAARPAPSFSPVESLPVPLKWRAGQVVVLALIAALALYYHFIGSRNPAGVFERSTSDYLGFLVLAGLTWFTTPIVGTLAISTLYEAVRRRWVIGFVGFSLLVLAFSGSLTFVQLGEEQRFLQDFGTGFIIAMTLLIAIFLGVTLVPPEIERRTIFTILSKPVNRAEFLLGKFLGLALTLFCCLFILGTFFLLVFLLFSLQQGGAAVWTTGTGANPDATLGFQLSNLAKALTLHYGQLIILGALSMMLSLIVSPITAITFCFLAFFGGQMSSYWGHLGGEGHAHEGEEGAGLPRSMQVVVKGVYYLLPRMDHFDVRQQLVTDTQVAFSAMWKAWSSGLLYVAVLLVIAYLVFSDREF